MKLWQKDKTTANTASNLIETFTVGNDRELDMHLAEFDVLGSLAHTQMLASINLISKSDLPAIQTELKKIYAAIKSGQFIIEDGVEDIHSQVELTLTRNLGEAGKTIHSGRSRNDQVLLDIKLFTRFALENTVNNTLQLFELLLSLSEQHKDKLLPGYTHLQIAMPSSFGLWFGAYAESLTDDMEVLLAAYNVANKNPLGSGAGYGSSFPLNRQLTTDLLGFAKLNYNVVYAQMTRGKTEKIVVAALANMAATLGKMAMDVCLYMSQNFGFISFPDELTTGSSIMPHKKNPDVFELIRAKCNRLQALPNELSMMLVNLPSGYHRDLQLTKDLLIPAFTELNNCLSMSHYMLKSIVIKKDILTDEKYKYLFSVENVNNLVLAGLPFREAYKKIGTEIEAGTFNPSTTVNHTHAGSIGNLCNAAIKAAMQEVIAKFPFKLVNDALEKLLK